MFDNLKDTWERNRNARKALKGRVTKRVLIVRLILGGYLLYLSYGLIKEMPGISGKEKTISIIALVIFVAVAIAEIVFAALRLMKHQYEDLDQYGNPVDVNGDPILDEEQSEEDAADVKESTETDDSDSAENSSDNNEINKEDNIEER